MGFRTRHFIVLKISNTIGKKFKKLKVLKTFSIKKNLRDFKF
jgi:hypothetical protein